MCSFGTYDDQYVVLSKDDIRKWRDRLRKVPDISHINELIALVITVEMKLRTATTLPFDPGRPSAPVSDFRITQYTQKLSF